jgi:hypothetical protein
MSNKEKKTKSEIIKGICNLLQNHCVIAADLTNNKTMDEGHLALMIPIITLIGAFIVIINLRKYQNIERMAMIEKGVDPAFFNVKSQVSTSWSLRASLLMIGAGAGLLVGHFLDRSFDMEEVAYFSMLFIFGGMGLGASYLIEEKKLKAEKTRL